MDPVPWPVAWQQALYAPDRGFYVTRGGPSAHFTTATHGVTGAVMADALLRLWHRAHGDSPPAVVVDVGAGRGELATHVVNVLDARALDADPLARVGPGQRLEQSPLVTAPPDVLAVDVVARPPGLDPRVAWLQSPGGATLPEALAGLDQALVIGHEWLDVVPCTIAEVAPGGELREVLVDPATGAERLGGPLEARDAAWAAAHWPGTVPGDRVEVGVARDAAWGDLVSRVRSGLVVAVDYGHVTAARPRRGTLAAYRSGMQTDPVPDGSCDITAHVAMDTLGADDVATQRDVLRGLGMRGSTPEHALALRDPLAYVRALERASAEAELIRPNGFGDFWWAIQHVRVPHVP
ncbi:SAM-dependent methyltransferase [Intrasporangium sp. DVR]|uniref:SAM-dependent methyltransferase n=1 Tax=Intrasporangium sp. DVR TaxID=3127867 RepID=UPI00333FDEEB